MKRKVNKKVGTCVHMLLKVARDEAFNRLLKVEKGKTTHKITGINRRPISQTIYYCHINII